MVFGQTATNWGAIFSNWLAESGPNNLVRVSAPQGCLLPKAKDERPLIYLVAGIGVTPAIAGVRQLRHERSITVVYSFRGEPEAPYLDELRQFANATEITLYEHDSSQRGRLNFHQAHSVLITTSEQQACEVVVCGPDAFNSIPRTSNYGWRASGATASIQAKSRSQGHGDDRTMLFGTIHAPELPRQQRSRTMLETRLQHVEQDLLQNGQMATPL